MDLPDQRPDGAGPFPDLSSSEEHPPFPADGGPVGADHRVDPENTEQKRCRGMNRGSVSIFDYTHKQSTWNYSITVAVLSQ